MSEETLSTMTRYLREDSRADLTPSQEDPRRGTYRILRGAPKACLVTVTDGVTVWFGISRCHDSDLFSKRLARRMAAGRAETARAEFSSREPEKALLFTFDAARLCGACEFGDLEQLLDVFYTLDKSIYRYLPKLNPKTNPFERVPGGGEETKRRNRERTPARALPLEKAVQDFATEAVYRENYDKDRA